MANAIRHMLIVVCVCSMVYVAYGVENITCDIVGAANETTVVPCKLGKVGVTWSKNGAEIVTTDKKYTVDNENGTLVIIKLGEAYAGGYNCTVGDVSATVVVCSTPYVRPYDKAKNVIEDDPLQIECHTWGFPPVAVVWYSDSLPVNTSDPRVTFKNGTVENSTLRIEKLKYEDEAAYTCISTNLVATGNATLEVNVKDKYAALWPFLGICVEVFILCTIILLYERRRTKQMKKKAQNEEADDFMTANNDTKVAEDVRHRK